MDVARPYRAICPTVEGDVLQVLSRTERGLTGREVALLAGKGSHSGVLKALNRLTAHGLVKRVELNRAYLFTLNREHLAYPAVVALTTIRTVLLDSLKAELRGWQIAPLHVSLFGSTARGDGDTESDIDLFAVRPATVAGDDALWVEQVGGLEDKISAWTGNRAAVHEVSEAEVKQLVLDDRAIVRELRADAILLCGLPVAALLGEP
jgi:predicted nucleotidyltransferase